MTKINVRKRGSVYQYRFEIASVDGKRKYKSQSGFKTQKEAFNAGAKAYTEYLNTGRSFKPSEISYSDYLDYWMKQHCEINLQYRTITAYQNIIKNHVKTKIGMYRLSTITTATLQEFINDLYIQNSFSKNFLKNILKVLKSSFGYAADVAEFIKSNPALKVRLPKYDISEESDPIHIFTKEEVDIILERFRNNHCVYYAFLTAYYTGLRLSEVFGLTWDDVDFDNKRIRVDRNIVKKNQAGGSKKRFIDGKAAEVWYFGPCKTKSSYRFVEIGDTLVNALKKYKEEQEIFKEQYGDTYMKNYKKEVKNPYTNKPEIKILSAIAEIEVALPEANLVFVKNNGIYEGTDSVKYPFKVIHYELGINCRFHDFRHTHATRSVEAGADIKAVSERLGHKNIQTTYELYVKVTKEMKDTAVGKFEEYATT